MTPTDTGQEHAIADCGSNFKDVEERGYAIVFFTRNEYMQAIELLAWLEENFNGNEPKTDEGKKRKEQFELLDKTIHKRWNPNAEAFVGSK